MRLSTVSIDYEYDYLRVYPMNKDNEHRVWLVNTRTLSKKQ